MKERSKIRFQQLATKALSASFLAVSGVAVSVPCRIFYYQPKTPENLKERLANHKSANHM
jgi:cyclic lactone autoinducer peptide